MYVIPNGVQKNLCGVHPGRFAFVGGDERGNDHIADRILTCQRVPRRGEEVWLPDCPNCGRLARSLSRHEQLYRYLMKSPS